MGRGFGRGAGAYRLHCWQNRWRRPATSTTGDLECVWHTLCLRLYCAASFRSALHRSAWHLGPPPAAAPLLAGTGDGEELEAPPTAASLGGFWSSSSACGGSAPSAEPEPELEPSPAAAAAASAAMDAAATAELDEPLRDLSLRSMEAPASEGGAAREMELWSCDGWLIC